jgi:hypothetical protein
MGFLVGAGGRFDGGYATKDAQELRCRIKKVVLVASVRRSGLFLVLEKMMRVAVWIV